MFQALAGLAEAVVRAADRRPPDVRGRLAPALEALAADYAGPAPEGDGDRLARIRAVFDLDDVDLLLLTAAVAPELDASFAAAYAAFDAAGTVRPTVALALELAGLGTLEAGARSRLGPGGPLRRHGLVELTGDTYLLGRQLRVPDRVAAHLAGDPAPPERLRDCVAPAVPLLAAGAVSVARAVQAGMPLVWIREPPGAAGVSLAAGALESLGITSFTVDARRAPTDAAALGVVVRQAVLEAGLRGAGLVLDNADLVAEADPALLRVLEDAAIPVLACSRRRWDPAWPAALPLAVEASVLDPELRAKLWVELVGDLRDLDPPAWQDLVGLRLTPEQIWQVAGAARDEAATRAVEVDLPQLRAAARRLGGGGVTGATTVGAQVGFDSLVLPADTMGSLQELLDWARYRDTVLSQGPVAGAGAKGRGIAALFSGNPGTGKTLAAQVIASSLGLDLQTVDLSAIVDKYIGETEKNLEKVFHEAESLNVVLFFDEADALFGSRSEVRDARDRYANQEVAYLLQRMEMFDGIAVLATNLRGNLDPAFSRRLHFIVHFPDPDKPTRERLWHRHLSALAGMDPADPVDVPMLAERVELAGGDIRNIVLAAAYAAAAQNTLVGGRIVAEAVAREYRKLGRRIPEKGFGTTK